MHEPIEPELSTLSTAPTVRTSVETNAISKILEQEEEKSGECEGGKKGEPSAVEPGWARALSSIAWCRLGRCAFADPTKPSDRYLAAIGCDGYHASRHVEPDGRVTVRWYLCARHRDWWKLERTRRAAARGG